MCGGGGMHVWGMVWELGSRCDTSHARQRAVGAVSAAFDLVERFGVHVCTGGIAAD